MAHKSLQSLFIRTLITGMMLVLTSCSNPLSGNRNQIFQNFHSKNVNCNSLNFSGGTFTTDEVRGLAHCLNSSHEIEAIETLLSSLNDAELSPLAEWMNDTIRQQPKLLYALKETYLRSKSQNRLSELQTIVMKSLEDPKQNEAVVKFINKNADSLSTLLSQEDTNFNMSGLYALTGSNAYQRFGREYLKEETLHRFILSLIHYLNAGDAKSIEALTEMIESNHLGETFRKVIAEDPEKKIQNLSHFFEWLFTDGHYQTLSSGVLSINHEPFRCFQNSKEIKNPIISTLKQISMMSPSEASRFFSHDIKNLILFSQGYCTLPHSLTGLVNLIERATGEPGFAEAFDLLKPFFNDKNFLEFIESQGSAQFVKDNGWLAEGHFFEDLFTMSAVLDQENIFSNPLPVAKTLDTIIKKMSDAETTTLLNFLHPALTSDEYFGHHSVSLIYKIFSEFPAQNFAPNLFKNKSLSCFFGAVLQKPALTETFNLISSLIRNDHLNSLIDQTLVYFNTLFERGKFSLHFNKAKNPEVMILPVFEWQIEKIANFSHYNGVCENLSYDWNFNQYQTSKKEEYLTQINSILKCLNPNQTFKNVSDLVEYSVEKSNLSAFLSFQSGLIQSAFKFDTPLSLAFAHDFLDLESKDLKMLNGLSRLFSEALNPLGRSLLSKKNLREYFAKIVSGKALYGAIEELSDPAPARVRSSIPALDPQKLTTLNAIVTRDQRLKNVKTNFALKAMFDEYCPSLDDTNHDCAIDSDQIELYLRSPDLLYNEIASEFMNSTQSWIHPKLFQGWKHVTGIPTEVSEFEFHLNPILHSFRGAPEAPRALLNAVKLIKKDGMGVADFLKTRALKLTLIPYIYQVPDYPAHSKKEYSNRIRLKLVSDLDRLELLAINADFKAFNYVQNIGMGFIREIGFAWGDVPESNRPASLSQFQKSDKVRTLVQVKDYINSEMSRFDLGILQTLGNCDPRGHGILKGWLVSHVCNSEISDLSSRVFNLRFLISLMEDEVPIKDGGAGGLEFMRDLFYGLYESNLPSQRNTYANGVTLQNECLENPLNFNTPLKPCQKDILTLVPRITHLGLLHQVGLSIMKARDNPVDQISNLIERVSQNEELSQVFVDTLRQDTGIAFIRDAVDYGFQTPKNTAENLSLLIQTLSTTNDLTWVKMIFELIPKIPHFPKENQDLLNSILTTNTEELRPRVDQWLTHSSSKMKRFLDEASEHLNPAVRNELTQYILELTPNSNQLADTLNNAKKLPALDSPGFPTHFHSLVAALQLDRALETRTHLGNFVKSSSLDEFYTLFADPTYTEKTYNFLEAINQNPDSQSFLKSCEDFLKSH